jgi:predicted RecB family nuclease
VAGGRLGAGTDGSAPPLVVVDVYANGAVHAEALPPERLGLRGLTGVGASRAEALREAGLGDRAAVADAPRGALTELPGVGEETARGMRASARAVARGEVVPTGGGSPPDGEPVFVDIETDGLAASTAWLIGVLDGGVDGSYLAFREREPGDGGHVDAFLTWLEGNPGRPVVAYNGDEFDFPVLREQVAEHCPDRLEAWDGRYTFDPLSWARRGNAALPGRTNRLEAVAEALGWEPRTRGLDGATAAETYLAWRDRLEAAADPSAVAPPDWERLEAYCEDDVRALATVYDALREAAWGETSVPTGAGSAQGSLSDFG